MNEFSRILPRRGSPEISLEDVVDVVPLRGEEVHHVFRLLEELGGRGAADAAPAAVRFVSIGRAVVPTPEEEVHLDDGPGLGPGRPGDGWSSG